MLLLLDSLENQEVDLCGQSRPVWEFHSIPSRRLVPIRHNDD